MNKYLEKIAETQEHGNHFWRNAAMGGATLGAVAGGAFLARKGLTKLRAPKVTPLTAENFSSRSPVHKELHDDLENFRKEALHYHIFAEGNAQRISIGVEDALKRKYPRVLAHPLMPDKYSGLKDGHPRREALADYVRLHKVDMGVPEEDWGWRSFTHEIKNHISAAERTRARDIVSQHVKDNLGH